MPRPALTEEQRRQIRRRIREAASELYATSGLAEISARSIAKKAGVSVGTIYSHFDNLPELMQSLWRQPVRQLVQDLETVAENTTDPLERIHKLLNTYAEFARNERAVYRGAFMFVRPESHAKPPAVPVEEAGIPKHLITAIREGQKLGKVRQGNPAALAELLWAGMHGALSLPDNLDRVAFSSAEDLDGNMVDLLTEWIAA